MGLGSWLGGGVLAFATPGVIVGVDQSTGKERWSLQPPTLQGTTGAFCGGSTTSVNGSAVVAVATYEDVEGETEQICNTVMLLDLSTGKSQWLWTDGSLSVSNAIHAEIVDDTVVADVTGQIMGLSMSNGQPVWQFQDSEVDTVPYDACDDQFMNSGSTLDVFSVCEQAPSVLSQLDPASGKVEAKTSFPTNMVTPETEGELLSASPGVVAVSADNGGGYYLVVDGGRIMKISQTGSYGSLDMDPISPGVGSHELLPVVISEDTMVTRNVPRNPNAFRTPDDLVAFDLRTGKEIWSRNLVKVSKSIPFAVQGGNVLAMVTGVAESPPQVFQVSLKTGVARSLGPPYNRSLIEVPNFSQLYWQNNHVYGAALSNIGKGFLLYGLS